MSLGWSVNCLETRMLTRRRLHLRFTAWNCFTAQPLKPVTIIHPPREWGRNPNPGATVNCWHTCTIVICRGFAAFCRNSGFLSGIFSNALFSHPSKATMEPENRNMFHIRKRNCLEMMIEEKWGGCLRIGSSGKLQLHIGVNVLPPCPKHWIQAGFIDFWYMYIRIFTLWH